MDCKKRLFQIRLMEKTLVNKDGFESSPKFNHKFFHPSRYVPPTNPTLFPNMSPVIGEFFCATK